MTSEPEWTDEERKRWNDATYQRQYICNACNQQLAFGRINAQGCPHCGKYEGFHPADLLS
jgi:hypothetical protein